MPNRRKLLRLLHPVAKGYLRTLRVAGAIHPQARPHVDNHAFIGAHYHNHMLPLIRYCRGRGYYIVVSQSRDGDLQNDFLRSYGFQVVRGSSTRGGVEALRNLRAILDQGSRVVGFSVDGPKGPLWDVKPGIIHLARKTQKPIVCMFCYMDRAWRLHTWDRLYVPKPFARVLIVIERPIYIEAKSTVAQRENARKWFAGEMMRRYREGAQKFVDTYGKKPCNVSDFS